MRDGCRLSVHGRAYWLIAFHFTAVGALTPFLALIARQYKGGAWQAGVFLSAVAAGGAMGALLAPYMVQRWQVNKVVVASCVGISISVTCFLLSRSFWYSTLFLLVWGAGQFAIQVALQEAVGASTSVGSEIDERYGMFTFFASIGQIAGPFLGGGLAAWRGTYAPILGTLLLQIPLGMAAVGWRVDQMYSSSSVTPRLPSVPQTFSLHAVRLALTSSAIMVMSYRSWSAFAPILLTRYGSGPVTISLLFAVRAFTALSVRPFLAVVTNHLTRPRVVRIAILLAGVSLAILGVVPTVVATAASAVLLGLAQGVNQPASMSLVALGSSEPKRVAVLGTRLALNNAGGFLGPLVLGLLVDLAGYGASFVIVGMAVSSASVLFRRYLSAISST